MFIKDLFNNIGRYCSLSGDTVSRRWRVMSAMTNHRYMVRNTDTNQFRVVSSKDMRNLY